MNQLCPNKIKITVKIKYNLNKQNCNKLLWTEFTNKVYGKTLKINIVFIITYT